MPVLTWYDGTNTEASHLTKTRRIWCYLFQNIIQVIISLMKHLEKKYFPFSGIKTWGYED